MKIGTFVESLCLSLEPDLRQPDKSRNSRKLHTWVPGILSHRLLGNVVYGTVTSRGAMQEIPVWLLIYTRLPLGAVSIQVDYRFLPQNNSEKVHCPPLTASHRRLTSRQQTLPHGMVVDSAGQHRGWSWQLVLHWGPATFLSQKCVSIFTVLRALSILHSDYFPLLLVIISLKRVSSGFFSLVLFLVKVETYSTSYKEASL